MVSEIVEILHELNIVDYNIYDEHRKAFEMYFVKHRLDMTRDKEVREIRLRVYRNFEENGTEYLGNSDVYLYPGMDGDEIRELIESAWESALYVKNPYYRLPEKVIDKNTEKVFDGCESVIEMAKALYSAEDEVKDAFINSAEFFGETRTVNIITGKGSDISYTSGKITGEFVVQCKKENDVELYADFSYYDMEKESIRNKCAKQLKLAVERESAKRSPADYSGYPIVLTDSYVKEFLKFYLMRSNAAYVYPGYSDYKEGYNIMSDISIEGVPEYPYSAEGVKTVSRMIIEHGIVKNIHGNVMHLSYLNRPYIGMYENLHCVCNGEPMDRLLNGKYILVKNFSDFQMDPLTGDFGGEFRLAEISDGNGKRIVTGGTVTGNILKNADKIRYSGEYFKEGLYVGPSAVKIG